MRQAVQGPERSVPVEPVLERRPVHHSGRELTSIQVFVSVLYARQILSGTPAQTNRSRNRK
jgi:hypothetical protein